MRSILVYVGLDVHQNSIVVAEARQGRSPATVVDSLSNDWAKLLKCLSRIGPAPRLRVCYEAGPTGYDLARRLKSLGIACVVIAPSLVPIQAGQRVKTDRRDAARLAHLHRSGELVEVAIPEQHVEAMRDLERAREDAKRDERVARHRLDKFLLRHALIWNDGAKWTKKHLAWIRRQQFDSPALARTWASYLLTLEQATARVEQLTKDIGDLVQTWALGPLTTALQALRGVQLVTAVTLAAEIGDFARFARPNQLMAYVGLVPSEHSSGTKRKQGRITRTGNKHVRRLLVETAWNYRFRPHRSPAIEARRARTSPEVRAIAEKAERRLVRRFERLQQRGKSSQQVVTAIARELLGFVWAIAREERLLAA